MTLIRCHQRYDVRLVTLEQNASFSLFGNRSMSCVPACARYDPCKMESAARPSTGRCKIFATKSGYLGAKNLIASAYRCAIQQGFNELTRLFTGVGMEWFTGKRSRGPPRHAVMHLSHTAHTKLSHLQICVFYLSIWATTHSFTCFFLMANPLRADY